MSKRPGRKLKWGKVVYRPLTLARGAGGRYAITLCWRADGERPAVEAFLRTCREVAQVKAPRARERW